MRGIGGWDGIFAWTGFSGWAGFYDWPAPFGLALSYKIKPNKYLIKLYLKKHQYYLQKYIY